LLFNSAPRGVMPYPLRSKCTLETTKKIMMAMAPFSYTIINAMRSAP
jgi:hypothetical protein